MLCFSGKALAGPYAVHRMAHILGELYFQPGGTLMAATATATPTTRRKRRGRRGKVSGYFRSIFETEPGSFKKSNAELIERWIQDHPSHTRRQLKKVKANLANLRSHIRHKEGGGRK